MPTNSPYTRQELEHEFSLFKRAVRYAFLEAEQRLGKTYKLFGRGHDCRMSVGSKIGRIISDLPIQRQFLHAGGPHGFNFYPCEVVELATQIIREEFGYPGLKERDDVLEAKRKIENNQPCNTE